ncbi:response regulator transcription factor [Halorientalis brevis]|uniref:Response regulator transcription factor n=1 Tax=Halorientalis brevis TaxID=1126241 RepID=A0ABD6CDJ9_9EURY|nr:response regulator [Halorientalis brevis]
MSDTDASADLRALVVDDEREVADAYALRIRGFCDVETAYSGTDALSIIDDADIDVVLLDRHMPGMSGDDVLAELDDRGYYGRVIMVTAVDPGFDVLEMPFDDYLCKPVDREDVRAAIDHQRQVLAYETLGAYFSTESKRAVLEAEMGPDAVQDHDGYSELADHAARLERRARRLLADDALIDQFDQIGREEL